MTILSASSASRGCSAFASSHGARIQISRSSSVVNITGMAFGWIGSTTAFGAVVRSPRPRNYDECSWRTGERHWRRRTPLNLPKQPQSPKTPLHHSSGLILTKDANGSNLLQTLLRRRKPPARKRSAGFAVGKPWRAKMKSILIAAAITLIAASSVLASPRTLDQLKPRNAKAMVVEIDASGVYVNEQLIGRDPDPAIRESLTSEHYRRSGG
jgi:hypothetical protein